MKQRYEQRSQFIHAGIWSLAVLALLTVGMMAIFTTAGRRSEARPSPDQTQGITEMPDDSKPPVSADVEEDDENTPANPYDTEIPGVETDAPTDVKPDDTDKDLPTASFDNGDSFQAIMPVGGEIAKGFTDDIAVYSLTMNDYRVHSGIDITAPVGTPVSACADGVIERVWQDPFLGQCVEITHGGDIRSCYANLSFDLPRGIEPGVTVLAGDVIGGVGETMIIEMADSDHLHFSITVKGIPVDPIDYMK
ncbi:MAG: M23 family metallopeptidase [Clostridia bacterium]|nr:M23 family metallopeptidase [Clostridia bacterium]